MICHRVQHLQTRRYVQAAPSNARTFAKIALRRHLRRRHLLDLATWRSLPRGRGLERGLSPLGVDDGVLAVQMVA
jgi:hypothetical protein